MSRTICALTIAQNEGDWTIENLYVLVAFDPDAEDRDGEVVASWIQEAGFKDPKMIHLPTQLALITAGKPG